MPTDNPLQPDHPHAYTSGGSGRGWSLRAVLIALAAFLGLCLAGGAAAQGPANCITGVNFLPLDSNFSGPGGLTGVLPVAQGGVVNALQLDRDGDGIPDATFALPPAAAGAVNYFLSPGLGFVLATAAPSAPPCASGTSIVLLRVPTGGGSSLEVIHTDCLPGGVLNGNGRWYESGLCQRNLLTGQCTTPAGRRPGEIPCNSIYIARSSDAAGGFLRIYDLNDATPASTFDGRATFRLRRCVEDNRLTIDAGGSYLVVNHDLPCQQPTQSNLDLVSAVPSSPTFGQSIALLIDDQFVTATSAVARVSACSGDLMTIQFVTSNVVNRTFVLPRGCATIVEPPTGSCCTPLGGCTITAASDCPPAVGVFSPGGTCTPNPCPQPQPVLTVIASPLTASVVAGEPLTFVYTVSNPGLIAVNNVQLAQTLPGGAAFVAATGSPSVTGSNVNWSLGRLLPGAAVTRELTVTAPCFLAGGSLTNSNYRTIGDGTFFFNGPSVSVAVTARPLPTGSLAVSAVPSRPGPLSRGDTIEYTVDFTNTGPINADRLQLVLAPGLADEAEFDTVIDQGPGVANIDPFGTLSWALSTPVGGTARLVFRVRIVECFPASVTGTRLNRGRAITIADPCARAVASTPSLPAIAVVQPLSTTAILTSSSPAEVGPVAEGGSVTGVSYQAVRQGASIRYEATMRNNLASGIADGSFTLEIPPGLEPAEPALVSPAPAGAAYDSATRTLSFTGGLAPGGVVTLAINLTVPAGPRDEGSCRAALNPVAGTATCTSAVASLTALFVPPEPGPGVSGLLASDQQNGLWRHLPPAAPEAMLCMPAVIYGGVGRSASGDVWLAGFPSVMINPATLDLHIVRATFSNGSFSSAPLDVAVTPDGQVYFLVVFSVIEGIVFRYDRATGALTMVARDFDLSDATRLLAMDDGRLVIRRDSGVLVLLDPRGPLPRPLASAQPLPLPPVPLPACTLLPPATVRSIGSFALTPSGDIEALLGAFFSSAGGGTPIRNTWVYSLIRYDRATLAPSVLVPGFAADVSVFGTGDTDPCIADLSALGAAPSTRALAVFDDGDLAVGLASFVSEYRRVETTPTVSPSTVPTGAGLRPQDFEPLRAQSASDSRDFNGDGFVDPDDLSDFIGGFFAAPPDPRTDFNGDGFIDPDDLSDFIAAYFTP